MLPSQAKEGEVLSYEGDGIGLVTPFRICDFCILVGIVTTPFTLPEPCVAAKEAPLATRSEQQLRSLGVLVHII